MAKRPTIAYIDTTALSHNYNEIKKLLPPETSVMAIVKANAYGHGDLLTVTALEKAGCPYFGVAYVEEGVRLREGGVTAPIAVLAGIFDDQIYNLFEYNLTPVVWTERTAKLLNAEALRRNAKKRVHVKIDSGMGRLGVTPEHVDGFFKILRDYHGIEVEGVMSHFSESESENKEFSAKQLTAFNDTLNTIRSLGFAPRYTHMANSGAIIDIPESRFNMVRPGLMLYGVCPSKRLCAKANLKPVLSLKTEISAIKTLPKGSPVSYGKTFITQRDSSIAILPVGYGDGLRFALSNTGRVIIRGQYAPIIGRVCMDLCMADVTDIVGASRRDETVIIGSMGDKSISVEDIAESSSTIAYEVLTGISPRVYRVGI